jgi:hypothetical protein
VLRLLVFSGTHPRITDGRPLAARDVVGVLLDGLGRPGAGAPEHCPDHPERRPAAHPDRSPRARPDRLED